jgi:hypothetical protein
VRTQLVLAALVALALAGGACGRDNLAVSSGTAATGGQTAGASGAGGDDGGLADAPVTEIEGGACTAVVQQHPDEGFLHVDCTPVPVYQTNPPSSGNHYPIWADFQTYTTPVPWGHLVHDLEHGAIVIVYNCPDGCADEIAAAQKMIDAFPTDPICLASPMGPPSGHRFILAPDPHLDVRWAASAWTWTIRAPCFDPVVFQEFATAHYGMGREDLCDDLHEPFCDVAP